MATVSKKIADDIIAGEYPEDRWVKIVKYTDMGGKEAYGAISEGQDLYRYCESEFVRNPQTYWENK